LRNGFSRKLAGDVFISFNPGWVVKENQTDSRFQSSYQKVSCPIVFYGFNTKAQKLNRMIDAIDIAPALAHILRIRPPSLYSKNRLFELNNFETIKK